MVKVKRTITFDHPLDQAISLLAIANKQSYSGYIESKLLMDDAVRKTIRDIEKLPKFPEVNLDKIKTKKPLTSQ